MIRGSCAARRSQIATVSSVEALSEMMSSKSLKVCARMLPTASSIHCRELNTGMPTLTRGAVDDRCCTDILDSPPAAAGTLRIMSAAALSGFASYHTHTPNDVNVDILGIFQAPAHRRTMIAR